MLSCFVERSPGQGHVPAVWRTGSADVTRPGSLSTWVRGHHCSVRHFVHSAIFSVLLQVKYLGYLSYLWIITLRMVPEKCQNLMIYKQYDVEKKNYAISSVMKQVFRTPMFFSKNLEVVFTEILWIYLSPFLRNKYLFL